MGNNIRIFSDIKSAWKEANKNKSFLIHFLISIFLFTIIMVVLTNILSYAESRKSFSFHDPLLSLFNPIDLTWFTFIIIYISLFGGVFALIKHPNHLLLTFRTFTIGASLRLITMYFLPLDAPSTILPMNDPFVAFFGNGGTYTKDLFFSGHTATMVALTLTAKNQHIKWLLGIGTVIVAACVLAQHVHYTIDVISAPFFAYAAYRIAVQIKVGEKNII